ncbi:MAG: hypothetical protein SAK29_35335 [Scytonema sp. PMC 1069.18]|nr:hypothetical protein [Scytonema sp. PMC 1069.18]MEC4885610.1 hypothetical protein [Scytonema sp. PMC 1070.18]
MQVQNPNAAPANVNAQNLPNYVNLPVDSSITYAPINIGTQVEYHITAPPAQGVTNVHLYLNTELQQYWGQNPGTNGRCPFCNQVVNVWIAATVTGP